MQSPPLGLTEPGRFLGVLPGLPSRPLSLSSVLSGLSLAGGDVIQASHISAWPWAASRSCLLPPHCFSALRRAISVFFPPTLSAHPPPQPQQHEPLPSALCQQIPCAGPHSLWSLPRLSRCSDFPYALSVKVSLLVWLAGSHSSSHLRAWAPAPALLPFFSSSNLQAGSPSEPLLRLLPLLECTSSSSQGPSTARVSALRRPS